MEPTHPADYWKNYAPGGEYDRAAELVGLVYDNIDKLYSPKYSSAVGTMNAITIWEDDALVRTRGLLGYYKETGTDDASRRQAVASFNTLLADSGLSSTTYTASELSDAEHYVAAATITMVPIVGVPAATIGSSTWDLAQGLWGLATGDENTFDRNVEQLVGPDTAGEAYGMERMYLDRLDWDLKPFGAE